MTKPLTVGVDPTSKLVSRAPAEVGVVGLAALGFVVAVAASTDSAAYRAVALALALGLYLLYLRFAFGNALRVDPGARVEALVVGDAGVQLRKGTVSAVTVLDIGWEEVAYVLLAHLQKPGLSSVAGTDVITFMPGDGISDAAVAEGRSWVAGRGRRDDVRKVIAYLAKHRPGLPVREATF